MTIKSGSVEITLTIEELNRFEIKTSAEVSNFISAIKEEVRNIGFKDQK